MTTPKIRIYVCDDHSITRAGLATLINSQEDMVVIGEASDGSQAIPDILQKKPDIILTDIDMPGCSGIVVMERVVAHLPACKIIFLSMYGEDQYAIRLLRLGASGYINKADDGANILVAIRQVHGGKKYFSQAVAEKVLMQGVENLHEKLSQRETDILRMIASGKSTTEIAAACNISPKTVAAHRANIIKKIGVKRTAGLIHYAIKNNLIKPQ